MKLHTELNRFFWGLRTGAFGFYFMGGARAWSALARASSPVARVRPQSRNAWIVTALVVAAPVALMIAEGSRSVREATLLTSPAGTEGEVASLRGALDRYYEQRESGAGGFGREFAIHVSVSGYTSRICETDSTPFITAANTLTRPGVVALSRDLLKRYTPGAPFEFGDVIHIAGIGDFVVEDAMAGRWQHRADIWFQGLAEAKAFGRHKLVMTGPYGANDGYDLSRARRNAQVASVRAGAAP
jgi:3D (Asp-Asp-Asp) domain-containing protein